MQTKEWLVVVDPQVIFAQPDSDWASPFFAAAWEQIEQLAPHYAGRIIVTRWLPTGPRDSSWGAYFQAWPFADVPADDALYALTPAAAKLVREYDAVVYDTHKFGKWNPDFPLHPAAAKQDPAGTKKASTSSQMNLVITGVATDCCVLSTVLPAIDDGSVVTVATDATAGSTAENQIATMQLLANYAPMVQLKTTAEIIAGLTIESQARNSAL